MNNNTNLNTWSDGSPKSQANGFTFGYSGVPHGYVPGAPIAPSKAAKSPRPKAGFGANNGTIPGMGPEQQGPRLLSIDKDKTMALSINGRRKKV